MLGTCPPLSTIFDLILFVFLYSGSSYWIASTAVVASKTWPKEKCIQSASLYTNGCSSWWSIVIDFVCFDGVFLSGFPVSSASLHFTVYCHTFGGLSDPFVRVTEVKSLFLCWVWTCSRIINPIFSVWKRDFWAHSEPPFQTNSVAALVFDSQAKGTGLDPWYLQPICSMKCIWTTVDRSITKW